MAAPPAARSWWEKMGLPAPAGTLARASTNTTGKSTTQDATKPPAAPGTSEFGATAALPSWAMPSGITAGLSTGLLAGKGFFTRIVTYFFSILLVLCVILLFVHYVLGIPIFKLQAGAPGQILIPGFDTGTLYWSRVNPAQIKNSDLPIQNQFYNYTMILDMFIQNPMQFSKSPRILFTRGATLPPVKPTGKTLVDMLGPYNLAIALLPDTSDLLVSVLNTKRRMENIIIPNIPVQAAFRIGVVIMEKAMEVYIDGKLMKTRTFDDVPMSVLGDIYPAADTDTNIAKMRNLKIWPQILMAPEIRYAVPALSTTDQMNGGPMPVTASCTI